jgi:ATP-binding cassette subfamily B protein IrtA
MTAIDIAEPSKKSATDSKVETGMAALLRPYIWSFAVVVLFQIIGAVAGLAPLLAVVELGRTLLAPGPVDPDHVWFVVIAGTAGLLVRLLFTAASTGIGHLVDDRIQLAFRRALASKLGRVPIGWSTACLGSARGCSWCCRRRSWCWPC